jgi:hypothetical protein
MLAKKRRQILASALRKQTGLTYIESIRAAKRLIKDGVFADTGAWPFLIYSSDCECCGPILEGWKGPKGILTISDFYSIMDMK